MVAETDYGLVEGLEMLETSMRDNLVALDLEWRPDRQGFTNPVALMQLATPTACLLIRTRNFRQERTLPWALESFLKCVATHHVIFNPLSTNTGGSPSSALHGPLRRRQAV